MRKKEEKKSHFGKWNSFNYMHIEWPSWQLEINRTRSIYFRIVKKTIQYEGAFLNPTCTFDGPLLSAPSIVYCLFVKKSWVTLLDFLFNFDSIFAKFIRNSWILWKLCFYLIGILLWNELFHNCGFHLIKVSEFLSVLTYLIEKTKSRNFLDFVTEEYFSVVFGIFEESRGLWHVGWGIVGKIWKKSTKSWRT